MSCTETRYTRYSIMRAGDCHVGFIPSAVPMAALLPPHRTEPSDTFKGAIQFCTASALPCPPSQSRANPSPPASVLPDVPAFPSSPQRNPWCLTGHSLLLPMPGCWSPPSPPPHSHPHPPLCLVCAARPSWRDWTPHGHSRNGGVCVSSVPLQPPPQLLVDMMPGNQEWWGTPAWGQFQSLYAGHP